MAPSGLARMLLQVRRVQARVREQCPLVGCGVGDADGSIVQRKWADNRPNEIPINLLSANRWVQRELITTANDPLDLS
jgi:hypothetical protein